jgi:hypothetical protein
VFNNPVICIAGKCAILPAEKFDTFSGYPAKYQLPVTGTYRIANIKSLELSLIEL